MHQFTCAVLDTETTGLSFQKGDRLVEIAAVKIQKGRINQENIFQTLINPQCTIPFYATRVHRITNTMVEDAPLFSEVMSNLENYLSDVDYLFIHNARFDLSFLRGEAGLFQKELRLPKTICSMQLSKKLFPSESRHNLDVFSQRMSVSLDSTQNRHRALGDVLLTGKALLKLSCHLPEVFQQDLDQFLYLKN